MPTRETDYKFEPPSGWNRSDLHVVNHECNHAVVANALGVEIFEVRIDRPIHYPRSGPDPLGTCVTPKLGKEDRWKQLCIDLAPSVAEGKAPESPPSLDDNHQGDLFWVAVHCFEEEINETTYNGYVAIIEALLNRPLVRKKGVALGRALLERGAIPGDEIQSIFAEIEAEANGKRKAGDQ